MSGRVSDDDSLMFLFSSRSTPKGYQHSDIFSVNTYRFTRPETDDDDENFVYVKIHMKPKTGVKNFTARKAQLVAGLDPEFHTRSIYDDIEEGNFPEWEVFAQVVTPKQAEEIDVDIFDPTKTLSQTMYPLRKFGRIVLNENVDNDFAESEQSAFSPTNIVPGWALTPDPSKS